MNNTSVTFGGLKVKKKCAYYEQIIIVHICKHIYPIHFIPNKVIVSWKIKGSLRLMENEETFVKKKGQ